MAAHSLFFKDSNNFETLNPIITNTNTYNINNNNILSLYDRIISPSNQIPALLDKNSTIAQKLKRERGRYGGGDIDPKHLGGFFANDTNSYETQMWLWAIKKFKIRSILDVGCGLGYSTLFFVNHPLIERVLCIEGSTDAIEHSLVQNITIQHDYTLGEYWPKQTFDMLWSVEFLEHIDEKYQTYYMSTFKKAKLLFVTASIQGGWNHVNVRKIKDYWIPVFESYGFIYLENITQQARINCPGYSWQLKYSYHNLKTNGDRKMPYFYYTGMVFLNSLFLETNIVRNVTLFDEMLLEHMHKVDG
eukprot:467554_1